MVRVSWLRHPGSSVLASVASLTLALAGAGGPAPAPARTPPPPATSSPPKAARLPAVQPPPRATVRFDFDEDGVPGELRRPDDLTIIGPPRTSRHPSLIEIRTSFVPEIARSLEDL
jgi:hypothetical protein